MSRTLIPLSLTATLMAGTAFAEVPKVTVDIAPIHSLVSRVMEGVGTPDLIVQPGASPHRYHLRPSEAQSLQDADLVFWVSARLSPWLEEAIETLADDANTTELMEADGIIELSSRNDALFEKHVHGDHDDHSEDEHSDHDDHAKNEHDDHDDHAHKKSDPHAWLSPKNAMTWLNVIAGQLSAADPENAGTYFANAAAGRTEIEAVMAEVNATLDTVRGSQFVVFHDAYQYFENDFNFPAAGAISISDASDPSPARIAEIQARVADEGIDCVLSEPQFNPGLVATVLDGTEAKTGVADPLGSSLELGSALYPQLLRDLSSTLAKCL
ncbi:zinc ABC transporter substrate-binding protein [Planktotalea sp.]|uniref:zinc ABC transporter substrate-binding protein n=1 Tax=Planktotalea sp. TaxID=2029877 RepID=UPI003D6B1FF9